VKPSLVAKTARVRNRSANKNDWGTLMLGP
jgi:hypothetical protein